MLGFVFGIGILLGLFVCFELFFGLSVCFLDFSLDFLFGLGLFLGLLEVGLDSAWTFFGGGFFLGLFG